MEDKSVKGAEEPVDWSLELRRDLRATHREIVLVKGLWARAFRRWRILLRREVGVFRRRLRESREETEPLRQEVKESFAKGLLKVGQALIESTRAAGALVGAVLGGERAIDKRVAAACSQIDVRMPRDADDFETVCTEWMRAAGFSDAKRTPKGPDGGVDVIASDAVGQAKFHPSNRVSPEAIRSLVGSRIERGKGRALFFHYGPGYTHAAIDTAINTNVELYQLDVEVRRFVQIA